MMEQDGKKNKCFESMMCNRTQSYCNINELIILCLSMIEFHEKPPPQWFYLDQACVKASDSVCQAHFQ